MIGKTYPFLTEQYISESDTLFYTFFSKHNETVVLKAIVYAPMEKRGQKYYNWGFGDLVVNRKTGEYFVDDKVESNNGDIRIVFYTVISTLPRFFDVHPEAVVYVEGSDQQRRRVYQRLIAKHWDQIEPFYRVVGFAKEKTEIFQPGIDYECILISRKAFLDL
jgi:hypothetical protein